jgi:hypothetical protein
MPNWNAYEKIITTIYIRAKFSPQFDTFGYLTPDKIFHWQMWEQNKAKYASLEGIVENNIIAPANNYWEQVLLPQLRKNWDVVSYVEIVDESLSAGTEVPNWQNYERVE